MEHNSQSSPTEFVVEEQVRIDKFLVQKLPQYSRKQIKKIIETGDVLVNSNRVIKSKLVRPGDIITVLKLPSPKQVSPNPNLQIQILYEDSHIIIINKPAGIPSTMQKNTDTDTVVNALVAKYPELVNVGKDIFSAGLLHRLDVDTSGLLLAAKDNYSYEFLRTQFRQQKVFKGYLAVVKGVYKGPSVVRKYIAHHPRKKDRMIVVKEDKVDLFKAKEAHTKIEVLRIYKGISILRINIPTGIMHQIRVTLASLGYPIIGDKIYVKKVDRYSPIAGKHHALYSVKIGFVHPQRKEWFKFSIEELILEQLESKLSTV